MIDRWAAAASGPAKDTLFDTALGIRQIEVGFASMLGLFLGVTAVLYGVALTQNRRFSNWLGWLAVVGGLATVSAGVVIAHEGFSNVAMMINMPSNLLLLVWMVAVGVGIWRLRSDQAVAISTD
jgi:hypothetical protein